MINVPYFVQSTPYTCGPASLNMMLLFHGVKKTEQELHDRLNTNPEIGTRHRDMIRVAQEEGFYVFENDNSSVVEIGGLLKHHIPVIVHFTEPSEDEHHYAVVVQVDSTHLMLNDPWNGEKITMEIEDFMTRWSSEKSSEENWLMAISKEPFSLGRQYDPIDNAPKQVLINTDEETVLTPD
ncbi:MAG: cysteine peptidase family C39 domain-containing protein [Candidatus Paceibacterota bacterium]|jgi:predicted double-glycine peptidase